MYPEDALQNLTERLQQSLLNQWLNIFKGASSEPHQQQVLYQNTFFFLITVQET